MAGTLLEIQQGKIEKGTISRIIESKNRLAAGATADGCGLYLSRVFY